MASAGPRKTEAASAGPRRTEGGVLLDRGRLRLGCGEAWVAMCFIKFARVITVAEQ